MRCSTHPPWRRSSSTRPDTDLSAALPEGGRVSADPDSGRRLPATERHGLGLHQARSGRNHPSTQRRRSTRIEATAFPDCKDFDRSAVPAVLPQDHPKRRPPTQRNPWAFMAVASQAGPHSPGIREQLHLPVSGVAGFETGFSAQSPSSPDSKRPEVLCFAAICSAGPPAEPAPPPGEATSLIAEFLERGPG